MLARERWQVGTIRVLEMVFEERKRQLAKHGEAMRHLPDGTGPDVCWVAVLDAGSVPATEVQKAFRFDYEMRRGDAEKPSDQLARMHLVREELAEAFELDGDDPDFVHEIIQVAALCVQWAEYKLEGKP